MIPMFSPDHFLFAPSHRIPFIGIGGADMSGTRKILLNLKRPLNIQKEDRMSHLVGGCIRSGSAFTAIAG
jgi:hypothetical protein